METIISLFEESARQYPDNPLLWEKKGYKYQAISYKQAQDQVYLFGAGLMALGLKKGERVGLLSEGSNDWLIGELAILYCGAVNVPLSIKLDAEKELLFRLEHSESRFILVSSHQLSKIRQIKGALSHLEGVVVLDDDTPLESGEFSRQDILKMGQLFLQDHRVEFEGVWKGIRKDDIANISYTSGTTADPKGVMLSHRNYTANVEQASSIMRIPETYRTLAILPWDHCFAHTACLYSFIYFGASIASVQVGKTNLETLRNVPVNISDIRPNVLMSVPALAKNFRKNIEAGIRSQGKQVERFFIYALKVAYWYNGIGWNRGKGLRFLVKPLLNFYDRVLFSKIRKNFGGELKYFVGGGALLDIELQRFFYAIGIPMYQGYGLSEASPIISCNGDKKHKLGSSGFLVSSMDLKICDDQGQELPNFQKGEIVIRGENVMKGYWKNEEATRETIKEGWLHTGDMGYMDNDGFLYVTGRFKSLLIGGDGEKYSPEGIEEAIVDQSPFIDQCMIHNNQDPYTVGLIVPNRTAILNYLKLHMIPKDSEEGLAVAIKLLEKEVNNYKGEGKFANMFPQRWLPATFAICPESFNDENKLLNSTFKMVRGKVTGYFKRELDYLYSPEGKKVLNDLNKKNLRRFIFNNQE